MTAQADFAAALLDPGAPCPAGLRAWNGADVSLRFAVYRNNVAASLIGVLADTFPVVQALVGPEFFRAMAGVFLQARPPRRPLMAQYGTDFADFVDGFAPAASVPYLADVARLEMARVEALHAADAPRLPVDAGTRALSAGERVAGLHLRLHPAVRLVRSSFPVFSVWAAHHGQGELESVDMDHPESVLVLRPDLEVLAMALPAGGADFLDAVWQGKAFGECAAAALAAHAHFDIASTVGLLLQHHAIIAIDIPPGDPP